MQLKILMPSRIFATIEGVSSVVADTMAGSMGFLPQRLDCVAALVPGILTYTTNAGSTDLAVDEGVLIKTGELIMISVRHALGGTDLGHLNEAIHHEFLTLNAEQTQVRNAVAKLASGLFARIKDLQHAR